MNLLRITKLNQLWLPTVVNHHKKQGMGVVATYKKVAQVLYDSLIWENRRPKSKWSYQYLLEVANRKMKPGGNLEAAIFAEYQRIMGDGTMNFVEVVILAPPDQVEKLSIYFGSSRVCVRCKTPFIPNSSSQKRCIYCQR